MIEMCSCIGVCNIAFVSGYIFGGISFYIVSEIVFRRLTRKKEGFSDDNV